MAGGALLGRQQDLAEGGAAGPRSEPVSTKGLGIVSEIKGSH